ncbi:xylulokinase [Salinifilum ghardaiensis]
MHVLGLDSSTQSTKAVLVDADNGAITAQGQAAHPEGTEAPPQAWWDAAQDAVRRALAEAPDRPVAAVSVAGQQHGMVAVDAAGRPVRDALLWNDTRSAEQARGLTARYGAETWARRTGLVPVPSFTVTKLAWLAEQEPDNADRVEQVLLPHDWVTWQFAGARAEACTDRGDASGTGYFDPTTGTWLPDLLADAMGGRRPRLPRVLGPAEPGGTAALSGVSGALLAPGTGDNMAGALGLGAQPGDVVVSLGTSGTAFAVTDGPTADPSGTVAGFCDATGRYLPLVCTLNAARVLSATAEVLGTDLAGLDELALEAAPGAGGLTLLPYLEGERTPDLPEASGTLAGLRRTNMTPQNLARAAVEGMLCGLADGVDALRGTGVEVRRVLLIGGAAKSAAVEAVAADLFGVGVEIPDPAEYVALGAAKQAAWVAGGGSGPPEWPLRGRSAQPRDPDAGAAVRAEYAQARAAIAGV